MKEAITAVILTFNEAPNIERTLSSVLWANEVLIVDSFSTDETLELARGVCARGRIVQRRFDTHTDSGTSGSRRCGRLGFFRSMPITRSPLNWLQKFKG